MSHKMLTDASLEPVTLKEVKAFMRLETPSDAAAEDDAEVIADNAFITGLIKTARETVENETHKALLEQTWTTQLDDWPVTSAGSSGSMGWWDGVRDGSLHQETPYKLEIDREPLMSVVSVETFDNNNVATLFPPSSYFVDTHGKPASIKLNGGKAWPTPGRRAGGILITYKRGYGTTPTDVPSPLRHAIMQLVDHWYENRNLAVIGTITAPIPRSVSSILSQYRKVRL